MSIFQKKKTPPQHIWHIDTKIISQPIEVFQKKRVQDKQLSEITNRCFSWIKNYFRTVGWIFFLGIACIGVLVFSTTPMFLLKAENIHIELVPEVIFDAGAVNALMGDFIGKNVINISAGDIFEVLQANIRHISSVKKSIIFPDGISVRITSFAPVYRAHIDEETYLLTQNGQLIPDMPELNLTELYIYHINSHRERTQTTPLHAVDIDRIIVIKQIWESLWPTKNIQKMDFFDREKELHIISDDVRYVLTLGCFSLRNEITKEASCIETLSSYEGGRGQLQTLSTLMETQSFTLDNIVYVDMRIPGKIFTCSRSEPQCQKNINEIYFY